MCLHVVQVTAGDAVGVLAPWADCLIPRHTLSVHARADGLLRGPACARAWLRGVLAAAFVGTALMELQIQHTVHCMVSTDRIFVC
jgi:hypothetical protein